LQLIEEYGVFLRAQWLSAALQVRDASRKIIGSRLDGFIERANDSRRFVPGTEPSIAVMAPMAACAAESISLAAECA